MPEMMSIHESPAEESRALERRNQKTVWRERQRQIAEAAQAIADQLNEPNIVSITRLLEIFGEHVVRDFATRARERFDEAQALGPEAYQPRHNGSDVATYAGVPRSCGGVFFYLMRAHATAIGLDWFGLRVSPPRTQPPATSAPPQTRQVVAEGDKAQQTPVARTTPATSSSPASVDATQQDPGKSPPAKETDAAKPNRIKATVIGKPLGEPKLTDQPGVLQLVFDVEMTPSMPKGLPTLGRSRVIALCTEKQYRHVVPVGGIAGRMIVEGEVAPTLSTAGKPLLVLVCTRLTTPDIEQAKHASRT